MEDEPLDILAGGALYAMDPWLTNKSSALAGTHEQEPDWQANIVSEATCESFEVWPDLLQEHTEARPGWTDTDLIADGRNEEERWDPRRGGYHVPGDSGPSYDPPAVYYDYPSEQECRDLYWQEQAEPHSAKDKRDEEDQEILEQLVIDGVGATVGGTIGQALGTVVGGAFAGPVGAQAGKWMGGLGGATIGGMLAEEQRLKAEREEEARDYCAEHGTPPAWTKPNGVQPGTSPYEEFGPMSPPPPNKD